MHLLANVTPREDPHALFVHWLRYYRAEGVTHFHFFVNRYDDDAEVHPSFTPLLSAPDVTIARTFWGVEDMRGRVELFRDYGRAELGDEPAILIADTDELIRSPAWGVSMLRAHDYDYVPGVFVDRFALDGDLPPVREDAPLPTQFPRCANFSYEALGAAFTKVPIGRPGLDYRVGFHGVRDAESLRAPDWRVVVNHFKWTDGLLARVRDRLARKYGGEKYLLECTELLERWVEGGDRIALHRLGTWISEGW